MARRINQDRCIQCGLCLPECPNEGIADVDGEYIIASETCTECYGFGEISRCVVVCPTDAIEVVPGTSDSEEEVAALAAHLRPDHFPRD